MIGSKVWHRTGDSGYLIDKSLFLTGRCAQLITTKHGYISPFMVEQKLKSIDGIDNGSIIQKNDKLVLAIQTKHNKAQIKNLVSDLSFDEIKVLLDIPMDPRHNSKIDYEKLAKRI